MEQLSNDHSKLSIGVDLGGTRITTVLANSQGRVIHQLDAPTPVKDGAKEIVKTIESEITTLLSRESTEIQELLGIGIACPGAVDIHRQIITTCPNLPGFNYFPLADNLSERFRTKIRIGNDLTLAGVGEHRFGAGKGVSHMIFLGIGTGIGGGIILDNKVYNGVSGSAGEIGHIVTHPNGPKCGCGNRGCLEAIASGNSLVKLARKRVEAGENSILNKLFSQSSKWTDSVNKLSSESIFEGALAGDLLSKSIITNGSIALGTGLATLVNLFNPQIIVIGGGLASQWGLYIEPAIGEMNRLALPQPKEDVKIVPSSLTGLAGALGAITLLED